jgi:N-acetyl-gamma-glutamylphosphate reductase
MKITLIGASGFVGTRLITLLKKAQRYEMLQCLESAGLSVESGWFGLKADYSGRLFPPGLYG